MNWTSPAANTATLSVSSLESAIANLRAQQSARGNPQLFTGPTTLYMSPKQYDYPDDPEAMARIDAVLSLRRHRYNVERADRA